MASTTSSAPQDGSFRIEVPASKPFILFFQPINTTPPLAPWTYPAKDPKTDKAMPLPQLTPGEVRNLGGTFELRPQMDVIEEAGFSSILCREGRELKTGRESN